MSQECGQIQQFFRRYPFGVLLLAILAMIVGAPLAADVAHNTPGVQGPLGLAPFTILLTICSAYAVWNLAHHRAVVIIAAGLILFLLGLSSLELHRLGLGSFISREGLNVVHVSVQMIFLIYVTGTILRTVFRARIVDGNILCGAACIYLLAGILWGFAYTALEIVTPDSFIVSAPDMKHVDLNDEPGWLVYFSFTTLTTVGFGDVLPAKAFARSLSVLEAVVGQIMLVVMMARLVGLHVAHTTSQETTATRFSTTSQDDG